MALFTLPKREQQKFTISPTMKLVIDSKLLDESQVKKFDKFPELLEAELESEELNPDILNLEKDIFAAVLDNDHVKFMRCVARVGFRRDMLARIYNWLLNKEKFDKRDLALFKRVEGASSVFSIFDY